MARRARPPDDDPVRAPRGSALRKGTLTSWPFGSSSRVGAGRGRHSVVLKRSSTGRPSSGRVSRTLAWPRSYVGCSPRTFTAVALSSTASACSTTSTRSCHHGPRPLVRPLSTMSSSSMSSSRPSSDTPASLHCCGPRTASSRQGGPGGRTITERPRRAVRRREDGGRATADAAAIAMPTAARAVRARHRADRRGRCR